METDCDDDFYMKFRPKYLNNESFNFRCGQAKSQYGSARGKLYVRKNYPSIRSSLDSCRSNR